MFRICSFFAVAVAVIEAQEIRHIHPEGLAKSPSYTHVVAAKPGRVLWISGQVAQNEKGEVVGRGNLPAQLQQVWKNLEAALKAGGASFGDIVKMNTYVVNYKPPMLAPIREARSRFLGTGEPPASTLVGVQALASEDYLVEIEAVAVTR